MCCVVFYCYYVTYTYGWLLKCVFLSEACHDIYCFWEASRRRLQQDSWFNIISPFNLNSSIALKILGCLFQQKGNFLYVLSYLNFLSVCRWLSLFSKSYDAHVMLCWISTLVKKYKFHHYFCHYHFCHCNDKSNQI